MLAGLAVTGCGRSTGSEDLSHDEVRAVNAWVLEKAISQPDSALMMIERLRRGDLTGIDTTGLSVRVNGPLPDYRCDFLRAKVYGQTLEGEWLDSAIIIGERLMTLDAAREDLAYRQDVLEMLINACRQHHDDELTIQWSAQLIDLCRQNGDETEALRTVADVGLMLSGIGRAEEGLAKIDSVLTLLSGKRKFNELDATIIALKRKVNVLKNLRSGEFAIRQNGDANLKFLRPDGSKRPEVERATHGSRIANSSEREAANPSERIVECGQQVLDLMADYEQHPDDFHDGTYREPPEHLRPGYIDFYRAQAYMFMAEAYASQREKGKVKSEKFAAAQGGSNGSAEANCSLFTDHFYLRKAKEYLSLFEQTDYAKTFMARKDFAPVYGLLGEYDKMLAIHDEQEARLRQQGDTINAEFATILRDRAMAAEAHGRNVEALRLRNAYETLTATLNDRLLQGKATLYAARFHAAEQQREIERHKATSRYLGIVGSFIAVFAVLALLFAASVVHKRRVVDQKNRALVKQIAEAAEYRKKYESLTPGSGEFAIRQDGVGDFKSPAHGSRIANSSEREAANSSEPTNPSEPALSPPLSSWRGAGGEASLFTHMQQVIKAERLYLDPSFDRQAASDYFQVTTRDVGAAFAQGSDYAKITDFINALRLAHAQELMTNHPEMSIDEVSTASGFSVRRTFSRLFKEKFGLTPTEFREAASAETKLA